MMTNVVLPVRGLAAGVAASAEAKRAAADKPLSRRMGVSLGAVGQRCPSAGSCQLSRRSVAVAKRHGMKLVASAYAQGPEYTQGGQEALWDNMVSITFEADVEAKAGQSLYLSGNLPELGAWTPEAAIPLAYPTEGNKWRTPVMLPAGEKAEFKLVLVDPDGEATWQEGSNREFQVPNMNACVHGSWGAAELAVVPVPYQPQGAASATGNGLPPASFGTVRTVVSISMEQMDRAASYCLVGSAPQLGEWTVGEGPSCRWLSPTELGSVFELPAGQPAEFKVVKVDSSGNAVWQDGNNRRLEVPASSSHVIMFASTSWQSEEVHAEQYEGEIADAKVEQVRLRAQLMAKQHHAAPQAGSGSPAGQVAAQHMEMARAY